MNPIPTEQVAWLRRHWQPTEPSFRQWLAGSDHAHTIITGLIEDSAALTEANEAIRTVPSVIASEEHWQRWVDLPAVQRARD